MSEDNIALDPVIWTQALKKALPVFDPSNDDGPELLLIKGENSFDQQKSIERALLPLWRSRAT